ncbi:MAG: HNH endonuclease [bacterium]
MSKTAAVMIGRRRFNATLKAWSERVGVVFGDPHTGLGLYQVDLKDLADAMWESLTDKHASVDALFLDFLTPYHISAFRGQYQSVESLERGELGRGGDGIPERHPDAALALLSPRAQAWLKKNGWPERAREIYAEWQQWSEEQRAQRRAGKTVGRGGRPITGKHEIGRGRRRAIYKRDQYECVYCGVRVIPDYEASGEDVHDVASVDHVVPGAKDEANLVTACRSCNSAKSNRTPEQAHMYPRYGRFRAAPLAETTLSMAEPVGGSDGNAVQDPKGN